MSDLISRSQLLKEIETWGGCVEALHEYIHNMPTAYDIDNVVGELEEAKVILANEYYCKTIYGKKDCENSNCFECCADYLIEIVKQGGAGTEAETIRDKAVKWNNNSSKRVPYEFIDYIEGKREIGASDDVCEWNLDGLYIFSPHSKMFSSVIDDKHRYTYCPVCGKKIKVVE